jgi:hypothetical protein
MRMPEAWEACMIPLHYMRSNDREPVDLSRLESSAMLTSARTCQSIARNQRVELCRPSEWPVSGKPFNVSYLADFATATMSSACDE